MTRIFYETLCLALVVGIGGLPAIRWGQKKREQQNVERMTGPGQWHSLEGGFDE